MESRKVLSALELSLKVFLIKRLWPIKEGNDSQLILLTCVGDSGNIYQISRLNLGLSGIISDVNR